VPVYALFIGQWIVVRFDTSECLYYLFVLGTILATERGRYKTATALFALGMLTKEPVLCFIAANVLTYAIRKRWFDSLAAALSALPYVSLQIALWLWPGELALASGPEPEFAPLPLRGYLKRSFAPEMALMPLVLFLPAIAGLGTGAYFLVQDWPRVHPIPGALLANALLIVFEPQEATGDMRAVGRIAIGLVLATILCGARFRAKRTLSYGIL
jgi:hypothetical protein